MKLFHLPFFYVFHSFFTPCYIILTWEFVQVFLSSIIESLCYWQIQGIAISYRIFNIVFEYVIAKLSLPTYFVTRFKLLRNKLELQQSTNWELLIRALLLVFLTTIQGEWNYLFVNFCCMNLWALVEYFLWIFWIEYLNLMPVPKIVGNTWNLYCGSVRKRKLHRYWMMML